MTKEDHRAEMAARKIRREERVSDIDHTYALRRCEELRAIRARERNFLDQVQR